MHSIKSLLVDKFLTVWWVIVIVLLALPFAVWLINVSSVPAQANTCNTVNGHQICVVSLRRSAARYWEYRTVVSIDGIKQPLEIYNCRDRTRTLASDGTIIPFLTAKTGDWICQLTTPSRSRQLDKRITIDIH